MKENSKSLDSRYLEINSEHLSRFLQGLERDLALDSARVEELLHQHPTQLKKMRAAAGSERSLPA